VHSSQLNFGLALNCLPFLFLNTNEPTIPFLLPKPFASWVLNEETCNWEPPVAEPEESTLMRPYQWNEETQSWDAPE
jgi:hypothetical protein